MVIQGRVPRPTRSESTAFINKFMTLQSRSRTADQSYGLQLLVSLATPFIAFQRKLVEDSKILKGLAIGPLAVEGNLLIVNAGIRWTVVWKLGCLEGHCERQSSS